jgi:soluble lytic murein transglycosylase-like protein
MEVEKQMPTQMNRLFNRKRGAIASLAIAATAAGGAATALASAGPAAGVPILGSKTTLERSADAVASREHYRKVYEKAEKLDVEPKHSLTKAVVEPTGLKAGAAALRSEVTGVEAKREAQEHVERQRAKRREAKASAYGTPESVGVDQATLDSIAACESGGDPTAVDPSGTYRGKYQFDMGTWASVGGSGDPAAAPEAEQDYRAAVLLSQSGSSPWPVCGS